MGIECTPEKTGYTFENFRQGWEEPFKCISQAKRTCTWTCCGGKGPIREGVESRPLSSEKSWTWTRVRGPASPR